MAESEEAAIQAFLAQDGAPLDSSQATQVVEDQAPAPATPFDALQNHLADHPYDTTAWQDLVNIAEESGDLKLIHMAYDSLLKVFPNMVRIP